MNPARRRLAMSSGALTGHAWIARKIASLIPFYEYDEERFFRCDADTCSAFNNSSHVLTFARNVTNKTAPNA
jgi:hypothetical protein